MNYNHLKITVALVCYQEKEELAHVLEDLKNQTAFDNIGEVLVFQNGTCQETRNIAKSFLNLLPLKIFSSPLNNLGLARATLVRKSQYDRIAWTDSDCRLPNHWISDLLHCWRYTPSAVAIGGPSRLPEQKWWQKMVNLSLSHPLGHGWSPQAWKVPKRAKVSHIPTTNGLFSKQAVLSVGNFSEKYKFVGEDLDLGLRLKKEGELILFPYPRVTNNYAKSYFESLKRLFFFGTTRQDFVFKGLKDLFCFGTAIRKNKSSWLHFSFLLFPLMTVFLILGLFQRYFLLPPLLYLLILIFASISVGFKNKKRASLLLPLFWFLQHFSYSMGATWGFFRKLNKFQKN